MVFSAANPPEVSKEQLNRQLFEIGEHLPRSQQDNDQEYEILNQVNSIEEMTRVTEEPYRMSPETIGRCLIWGHDDVHGSRFCDVFVTPNAVETMRSGTGTYPVGTVIVKAKYPDTNRESRIELYTVMRKMSDGYAPEFGNWEFSVVDGDARHVHARGKISSCLECHVNYAATDFVTRTYIDGPRLHYVRP